MTLNLGVILFSCLYSIFISLQIFDWLNPRELFLKNWSPSRGGIIDEVSYYEWNREYERKQIELDTKTNK